MDYEGQRLAELIFYWIILSFGAVGWVIGYFQQDFMVVFQFWLVGVAISVVVCWNSLFRFISKSFYEYSYYVTSFFDHHSFAFQIGRSTIDIL